MRIAFSKMHGAGNDFVMLDGVSQTLELRAEDIRFIADRHLGIGADQVLLVSASENPNVDFRYRIFNQDGSEVEQCGNGARCFVKFVRHCGLTEKTKIRVQTMKTVIEPELLADGRVKVNMGAPIFDLPRLPFDPSSLSRQRLGQAIQWRLEHADGALWFSALSMGNPTATVFVQDVETTPVDRWGRFIGEHPVFPNRTNVAFLEILDKNNARIRVFERGAGETLACGSGTCAAIVAAMKAGFCQNFVEVQAKGGHLRIEWDGAVDSPVYLIGPAEHVFDGEIEI